MTYRVQVNQGETYTLSVQWLDSAGVAVPLTGATAKIQLRDKAGGTVLAEFTSSPSAGLAINAATGTTTWTIASATSAAWAFFFAVHDLLVTKSDGTTKRLIEGEFVMSPQVTT